MELLRAFAVEQSEPARFYGVLADDSVRMIEAHRSLDAATVLDVGAGPPQFGAAFGAVNARYIALDADPAALSESPRWAAVVADGRHLPFADGAVDVCVSSNVIEHVSEPWALADEMVRVTRPGGITVLSYTNWLSPWGGHETSPWHYLGGFVAADRYGRRYGRPPKNRYGVDLFPVSIAAGLSWARSQKAAELIDARPRYLPRWCRPVLAVAGIREVVTWNLWMVLRHL